MPGWTASFDGLVSATALDDSVSYSGCRELRDTSLRVRGARSARLIAGDAPDATGPP
jgi:hypothetical protein